MSFQYKKFDFKVSFLDSIFKEYNGKPIRVLDMGCGRSKDFPEILGKYKNISYVGVESNNRSLKKAKTNLNNFKKVVFLNDFGETLKSKYKDYFDITLSLSVLEHVKYLEDFLKASVWVTKPGGRIVHRYDLGHALHSKTKKERFKVFLCKYFPKLVPSKSFTTHPDKHSIIKILESHGVKIENVFHSQLYGLKAMMNRIKWGDHEIACCMSKKIIEIDSCLSEYMNDALTEEEMEIFFPSIIVSGIRLKECL
jgi:SAM-dependent methyltransferase